ncbi:MAG: hypothetical protein ACKVKH_09700 [Verrucomicrobiales bacterium]|jgi:hypothetical protein|tara:strand:- start:5932 stop:6207 length:276 start_codon:yes stop_codon:yes gene_type:complete
MAFIRDQLTEKIQTGTLLGFWWASELIMNISSNYFTRNVSDFTTTEEAICYNERLMIDSGITIVASLLAGALIHKLTVGKKLFARERGLIL